MSNSPIVGSESSESLDSQIVGLELSEGNCWNHQIGWPEFPQAIKISYIKLLMMYTWNKTEMQAKSIHQSSRKVKIGRGTKVRDSRRIL